MCDLLQSCIPIRCNCACIRPNLTANSGQIAHTLWWLICVVHVHTFSLQLCLHRAKSYRQFRPKLHTRFWWLICVANVHTLGLFFSGQFRPKLHTLFPRFARGTRGISDGPGPTKMPPKSYVNVPVRTSLIFHSMFHIARTFACSLLYTYLPRCRRRPLLLLFLDNLLRSS